MDMSPSRCRKRKGAIHSSFRFKPVEEKMSKFVSAVKAIVEGAVGTAFVPLAAPSYAADDLAAAKAYTVRYCSQCHTFEQGEKHGQGPNLLGVMGGQAAAATGIDRSGGLQEGLEGRGM